MARSMNMHAQIVYAYRVYADNGAGTYVIVNSMGCPRVHKT